MSRLVIHDCSAETLTVSPEVETLVLWNVRFPTFPAIPDTVLSLQMDTCVIEDGSPMVLHEGLQALRIGHQTCLPLSFPSTLESLTLRKIRTETLPSLPEGLKKLSFLRVQTRSPIALPSTLETLVLEECLLSSYLSFPRRLRNLTITECYGRSLPNFPPNLQELSLCDLNLDYLPPIPASCVTFYEVDVEADQRGGRLEEEGAGLVG
jgi:hypothetical protein